MCETLCRGGFEAERSRRRQRVPLASRTIGAESQIIFKSERIPKTNVALAAAQRLELPKEQRMRACQRICPHSAAHRSREAGEIVAAIANETSSRYSEARTKTQNVTPGRRSKYKNHQLFIGDQRPTLSQNSWSSGKVFNAQNNST